MLHTISLKTLILTCVIFTGLQINAKTFLVFGGKHGWIEQKMIALLSKQGHTTIAAQSRLESRKDVEEEIIRINPDCIINAAGVTGRPSVD